MEIHTRMSLEKRRTHRIDFAEPVKALLADVEVDLIDFSSEGARVEHRPPMKAHKAMVLTFEYLGIFVVIECVVVRSRLQRSTIRKGTIAYQSGLRFNNPEEKSRVTVRKLVASMATAQMSEVSQGVLAPV